MAQYQYHYVNPTNVKDTYNPDDLVDFSIDSFGRNIVKNSIEIQFKYQIYDGGALISPTGDNYYVGFNEKVGGHTFFDSFNVSTQKQGSLENLSVSYPRFINMQECANEQDSDYMNMSKVCELKSPDFNISTLQTVNPTRNNLNPADPGNAMYTDACIKPICTVNRTTSDIPFRLTGPIRISTNLATSNNALEDVKPSTNSNLSYTLTEIRLHYRTVPDTGVIMNIGMDKIIGIKTTIGTSNASISTNVPSSACKGVVISFQKLQNENSILHDNNKLENPKINRLQFLYNGNSSYINYELTDQQSMISRMLTAWDNGDGKHQLSNANQFNSSNFMVGSDFNAAMIDLTQTNFEVQIDSDISETYNVYLYFLCSIGI
jgi:hypothetical protein